MNSMPQQAVTNGYWKMEYFRAQPERLVELRREEVGYSHWRPPFRQT